MYGELVSVILVTHNSSKFLSASVESILGQTYQNLELLITDDCSTDSTCDIISRSATAMTDGSQRNWRNRFNTWTSMIVHCVAHHI